MKKANVMIDLKNDKTIMFLTTVDVIYTDPGHYGILLNFIWEGQFTNQIYFCSYLKKNFRNKKKIAVKLPRQLTHPSVGKLITLLAISTISYN